MSTRGPERWLAIGASVVVVCVIVAAIATMGSPAAQRQAHLDEYRLQHLYRLDKAIAAYVKNHKSLPPDLATLTKDAGYYLATTDDAGKPYVYEITGDRKFRFCTDFLTDTTQPHANAVAGKEWLHAAGRHCFDRVPSTE